MTVELIPRDIYELEIYRIPYGIQYTKKTFNFNGEDIPFGIGFFWLLKIINNKEYENREVFDYIMVKIDYRYKMNPYGRKKMIDRFYQVLKALDLKDFNTRDLQILEGRKLKAIISVRVNKQGEKENFVESYLIN